MPNIGDKGALELYKSLVLAAAARPAVVLESAVQGLLLGVEQHRHPFVPVVFGFGLEMVGSETEKKYN